MNTTNRIVANAMASARETQVAKNDVDKEKLHSLNTLIRKLQIETFQAIFDVNKTTEKIIDAYSRNRNSWARKFYAAMGAKMESDKMFKSEEIFSDALERLQRAFVSATSNIGSKVNPPIY